MAKNRETSHEKSMKAAFCGVTAALSVVLMVMGGIIPIATYAVPMFAAVLLLPVLIEYGKAAAWTAYIAVSLISIFLGMDKEASFFYLFIGYYPIVKFSIDKLRSRFLRILIKMLIFNLSFALLYVFLGFVLHMSAVIAEFGEMGTGMLTVFIILFNVCMFIYDMLLMPLSIIYYNRIRPKLRLG